jgi:hypothetical protein
MTAVQGIVPQQVPGQQQSQVLAQDLSTAANPATVPDSINQTAAADEAASSQPAAALTKVGKPATASTGRGSEQVASRTSSGSVTVDHLEHGNHPMIVQAISSVADASNVVRDPAASHGVTSTIGGNSGGPGSTAAGSSIQDAFAALDATARPGAPVWTHGSTQRAEAGFQDPSLGWIGVRADASGGGVHATLVPGSADAAQTLGGHLAGLNAYLAEEHTHVDTLTLATPQGREAGLSAGQNQGQGMGQDPSQGASQDTSQSMNQGAGQNTGQGGAQESSSNLVRSVTMATSEIQASASAGSLGSIAENVARQGGHISVMA